MLAAGHPAGALTGRRGNGARGQRAPTSPLAFFHADQAYVVLAEVGETPKIYLWAGADAPKVGAPAAL